MREYRAARTPWTAALPCRWWPKDATLIGIRHHDFAGESLPENSNDSYCESIAAGPTGRARRWIGLRWSLKKIERN